MNSVNGRPLRPRVCSCERGCSSREEMHAQHGDPEEFLTSLERAFADGFITFDEAERANLKYHAEWYAAPEKTQVDKPTVSIGSTSDLPADVPVFDGNSQSFDGIKKP